VTTMLRALAATLALLLPTVAADTPYANPGLLVETDELARLLGAPGVRIVDLRGDAGRGEAAYRAGHVPGAVYLSNYDGSWNEWGNDAALPAVR